MNSSNPAAGDDSAYDRACTPAFALPRLTIIHLMALTAATAVAFMPFQVQLQSLRRMSPGSTGTMHSLPMTATSTLYGVAWGACLFVTAAIWHWKRKGWAGRLQPGHWLALSGAAQWATSMLTWLLVFAWAHNTPLFALLLSIPRLIIGLCFFVCFMWLALRRQEPARWRWAFAIVALTPVAIWFQTVVMISAGTRPTQMTMFILPQVAATWIEFIVLGAAMAGDWRHGMERHWSHWLGAGVRLLVMMASGGLYAFYVFFPQAMMGR